jgi:thiamine biosynthesis lipoprotein
VNPIYVHTTALMGTVVTTQIVGHGETSARHDARVDAARRAAEWFRVVESTCSRFDPSSELRRLSARTGECVEVSPLLFELLRFSLALAAETDGAFDPTVGAQLESRGFVEEHRSGERAPGGASAVRAASHRDVHLDESARQVTIDAPLVLDLGAVAKGFAIDLAARELAPFEHFAIDAGGDLYLGGRNQHGAPWSVGVRLQRRTGEILETLTLSDAAVCTSGDYERVSDEGHHIVDPRSGESAAGAASVTVIAPIALVADGLATAAFVLGPERGMALLERHGVGGILYTPSLERIATA